MVDLLEITLEGLAKFRFWRARIAQGELGFGAHDGQRCAQLMTGIAHKSRLRLVRSLDRL